MEDRQIVRRIVNANSKEAYQAKRTASQLRK